MMTMNGTEDLCSNELFEQRPPIGLTLLVSRLRIRSYHFLL
jgi:hypothetical protein